MFSCFLISVVLLPSVAQSTSSSLSGKHFRVGYFEIPFGSRTEVNAQNETVVRGLYAEMVQWMSRRQNFTCTFVLSEITKFKNLPPVFASKNIDWFIVNFAIGYGKNYIAQHTFPFANTAYSVIIPYPKPEVNVYSVMLPYTTSVWVGFFVSMALTSFLLKCFARAKKHIYQHRESDPFLSYEGSILYVVGVATNQGAACFSKARTVRLLAGIWCLAACVMVNAYSGSLITYMMAPKFKPLLKSIRDIDNKREPQILAPATNFFQGLVETSPSYQWLRDNVQKMPSDFCGLDFTDEKRNEQCLTLVKEGRHVYATDAWSAELYVHRDFKKTGTCALTLAEEEIVIGYGGWVLPLNSPHEIRNAVDVLLLEIISYGLLSHWDASASETTVYCKHYTTVDRSLRKLSLKNLASAFIILGTGIAISLIVFVYEILRGRLLCKASEKTRKLDHPNKSNQQTPDKKSNA